MSKSVNVILTEIRFWINQYHGISKSANIEDFLEIQDEIVIRSFTLASFVGEYKTTYNNAYFNRKLAIAKRSLNLQKSGSTLGKAENQALVDNEDAYRVEQEHEATAVTMDILLRQTNKILDAMAQRISYMKQERQKSERVNQT